MDGVRSKVLEIQDVVSIAAHGTVDCAQQAVTCVMARVQKPADQSLVGKAVSVSTRGLASALNVSEALVDRMLPPTEEEKSRWPRGGGSTYTVSWLVSKLEITFMPSL